jgi:hypothetical protein
LNLSQAAHLAGIAKNTLRVGIERGEVMAERPIACGPWVLNKKDLETEGAVSFIGRLKHGRQRATTPSLAQANLDLSTT